MKRKILLVYAVLNHPLRANTKHLIECFRQYGDADWFYLNLAHKSAPSYVSHVDYDLIIFQTTFTQRLSRSEAHYTRMMRRSASLAKLPVPKVALVQDEFWNVEKVERFINAYGIETVFSVAPESEWPVLYPSIDRKRVRFHRVLTGYLDEDLLDRVVAFGATEGRRAMDIVYRAAGRPSPAWGKFGYVKQLLADAVSGMAADFGLKADISTDAKDTLYGDDWIRFLASARYTIGAPSGTSLLDRDGSITAKVESFRSENPEASLEEIERHCFAGLDGNLQLSAIGPRHIEACATRTCQMLIEGDYNGLLLPNVHYIAIDPNLSNLSEVLSGLGDEERRKRIVERAFQDIVRPLHITYRAFAAEVLGKSLGERAPSKAPKTMHEGYVQGRMVIAEKLEWWAAKWLLRPIRSGLNFLQLWSDRL